MKYILSTIIIFLIPAIIFSEEIKETKETKIEKAKFEFLIRPFASAGYSASLGTDGHGAGFNAGAHLLLGANKFQRYGLEVSYRNAYAFSSSEKNIQFITAGFYLEQKFFKCFVMGIGTVGFIGIGSNAANPFGLVTNLGWEPSWDYPVAPFITYRAEFIFDAHLRHMSSLSCGITIKIK